ncbi:MAG: ABC transporter permease [Gemmatimonadaceae bacterium]
MPFFEAIRLALAQIRVQKLKSFFTVVGVMISVMFLIAVVSIVQGMSRYIEDDFAGKFLGVNTFNLRRFPDINSDVSEAEWRAWQRRPRIKIEDGLAVLEALPVDAHWAMHDLRWAEASSRFTPGGPQVLAECATPQFFSIKDLRVEHGRLFTDQDDAMGASVIVVGTEVAERYFPNLDPLGREIRIERVPFRVVGVLEKQGTVFGLPLDRQVIAPFHSPMERVTHARQGLYGVVIQAPTPAAYRPLQEVVREVMRKRHRLRPREADDFVFESSESALSQWLTIKKYLIFAGVVLPAIGLVVGAIVIMNIMLVAVAERTREVGIRKALGASRRDILAQFLVESATLSAVGSVIGVGLGIGLAALVAALSPLPSAIAPWSVAVAVGVGAGVGVIAGAYPASRAARLDPILAIRSE